MRNPSAGGATTSPWTPTPSGSVLTAILDATAPQGTAFQLDSHPGTIVRMWETFAGSAPSLDEGTPFVARAWFRALNEEALGSTFELMLWESGGPSGPTATAIANATFEDYWQVRTIAGAIKDSGRTNLQLFAGTSLGGAAPDAEYGLTGLHVESATSLSSYIDGDLGEGYAWTGTPHASVSTREAGSITGRLPSADAAWGGIALWLRPLWSGAAAGPRTVLDWRAGADRRLRLRHEDGDWRLEWHAGAAVDAVNVPATHAAGGDVRLFAWWTPRRLGIEVDGDFAEGPRLGAPPVMRDALLAIGHDLEDGARADAVLGPMIWTARPLRPTDRAVLARTSRPLAWAQPSALGLRAV